MTDPSWSPPPRSTPIPGAHPLGEPTALGAPPPTSAEFLRTPEVRPPKRHRGRNLGLVIGLALGLGGCAAALVAGRWATSESREAQRRADEVSDPRLSDADRTALGLTGDEQYLWEGAALAAMAAALDQGTPGEPTRFLEMGFYGDYASADAQDPNVPERVDEYLWRLGGLEPPRPEQNVDDAAARVFTVDEIDWSAVSAVAADAPAIAGIPDGAVTYVIVDRAIRAADGGQELTIRIYVQSARDNGYIRLAPDGTVVDVF